MRIDQAFDTRVQRGKLGLRMRRVSANAGAW